jgi:hypothetical protein
VGTPDAPGSSGFVAVDAPSSRRASSWKIFDPNAFDPNDPNLISYQVPDAAFLTSFPPPLIP